ncbi:MAG: hypothetical protein NC218_03480 [Acetobacter sp.]|nr:hypothetical protein [Acetobacter sp.]
MAGKNIDVNIDINADSSQATTELHKASKAVDELGESSVAASKRYEAAQEETQEQLKKTAKVATQTGESQEEASEKAEKAALKAAQEAQREWNNAYSKMKNNVLSWGESVNSTILQIGGNLIRKGLGAAVDGVKSLASQGFELQSELEGVKVALETMSTAGADADTVLKQIQKDAIITPFDVSSLSKATQRFTMITGNAEEAEKTVLNFGKALAAAGKGSVEITRVATNMQQIGNQARISQKDFNEFATAGINMTKLVSEYAGIAENEVMDYLKQWQTGVDKGMSEAELLAKGIQKPYDILVGAINKATEEGGVFANVYTDMAGTLPQMVNNMQETIAMGMANIFTDSGLEDELKGMMQAIGDAIVDSDIIESASVALGHLVDVFKEFVGVGSGAELIQKVFGAITDFLRDLASGKYDATIKNIFQAIKTFFTSQWNFNPLIVGMKLLIQVLTMLPEGAGNVIGGIAAAFVGLGSAVGIASKISGFVKPITDLVKASKKLKSVGTIVEQTTTKLSGSGTLLGKTVSSVEGILSKAAAVIKKAVSGIVDGLSFLASEVTRLLSNLLSSLSTLASNGLKAIQTVLESLIKAIMGPLNTLASGLGKIFQTIAKSIGNGLAALLKPLSDPKLLLGVASLAGVAGALWIFAQALQSFSNVSWDGMLKAALTLGVVTAALVGLSYIIVPVAIGAAALTAASVGIAAFGAALIVLSEGFKALGEMSKVQVDMLGLLKAIGTLTLIGGILTGGLITNLLGAVSGGALALIAFEISAAAKALNEVPTVTADLGGLLATVGTLELLGGMLAAGFISNLLGALSGGALALVAISLREAAVAINEIPAIDGSGLFSLVGPLMTLQGIAIVVGALGIVDLLAAIGGGGLLLLVNEIKSIAFAMNEVPMVEGSGLFSIVGPLAALQGIALVVGALGIVDLLAAIGGGGLLLLVNEIKSIAFAINEIPVVSADGMNSLYGPLAALQGVALAIAGLAIVDWLASGAAAGLLVFANTLKSIGFALKEASDVFASINFDVFEKLPNLAGIMQKVMDLPEPNVERAIKLRDFFDALGDAFDNDVSAKIQTVVTTMQKTNWATFGNDMEKMVTALDRDYPDISNFVAFFDNIGWALDNGVTENMSRLIDVFKAHSKEEMQIITDNASAFVNFVQGEDATRQWNTSVADSFREFFDNVGNALDMDVVPNMEKLLDVFNKFDKNQIATVTSNAQAFVNFIQGEDVKWDSSTAEKFKEFFDNVGWALDNDVAPNIQKLLDVFNNFSQDKMAVVLANAASFVEFVQGEGLPDKSKNWNADCAQNFQDFFDRVGWALDNEVAPNIGKLLEVFSKFSEDQLATVKTNAQNFVDFINGDLFSAGEGGTWNLDNVTNFMNFFDTVGWALDNGVVQAIDSLLTTFGRDPEAMQTAITNAGNFIKFVAGKAEGMGEDGWNVEQAINFMNYFDRLGDALDNNILDTVNNLFQTFSVDHGDVLETAKTLSQLVSGNGEYTWNETDAELFAGYMNKLETYALSPDKVKQIIDGFTGVDTTGATATANALVEIITSISQAFTNFEPNLYENGSRLGVQFRNGWYSQHEYIKSTATASGNAINDALNAFNGMGGPLWSTANEMTYWIVRPFLDYDWASHGRNAADGIISGVRSRSSSAFYAGYDLAQQIVSGIRAGGQEGSPWKLSYQSGVFAARGLINGAKDMVGDVKDMGEEIAQALMTGYDETFETLQADISVGDALGEASALGQQQAVTNNKNVHITNNNTVNSELDMAMVNSRINWEIAHAL